MIHKLSDIYSGLYIGASGGAMFTKLYNKTNTPYHDLMDSVFITPADADNYYLNYYSPSKKLSPQTEKIITEIYNFDFDAADNKIPANIANHWADMFHLKYGGKYNRLLDIVDLEYNPIENYDRYEDLKKTFGDTGTTSSSNTGSNTGTQTNINQIEGFNSSTFTDSDKSTRTDNLSHSETGSGSHTNSGTENNLNHIHGNIGVTTADQMIRGYLDVWGNLNILEMLCRDFDTLITTQTY